MVAVTMGHLADDAPAITRDNAEQWQDWDIDRVEVPVVYAAWTVVDCFRVRNKSGLDLALEALRDGRSQHKFTMDDLWRRATRGRVANPMRPYVEVITA